uniref:HDC17369 n=1 Tax=Drosophila melanogaster TaxID=7227 RepID=Q6IIQ1_DROME|nr:TPA_inf: HDC17369 [Drosophila melanogaster]
MKSFLTAIAGPSTKILPLESRQGVAGWEKRDFRPSAVSVSLTPTTPHRVCLAARAVRAATAATPAPPAPLPPHNACRSEQQ